MERRAGHELPDLTDDNLPTPVVGEWAEDKYRLVHLYAKLFTTSMRGKWSRLVYLDLFAGAGRSTVSAAKIRGVRFENFIIDAFGASMQRLDYIYNGIGETQLIRLPSNNAPLYRLALFSRHKLGTKFWREVRKYAPDQRSLF